MEVQEKIDQQKLEAFLGKAVSDYGSAVSAALVLIGDTLVYRFQNNVAYGKNELTPRTRCPACISN